MNLLSKQSAVWQWSTASIMTIVISIFCGKSHAADPNAVLSDSWLCSVMMKDFVLEMKYEVTVPTHDNFTKSLVDHFNRSVAAGDGLWTFTSPPKYGTRLRKTSNLSNLKFPMARLVQIIEEVEAENGEVYLIDRSNKASYFGITNKGTPLMVLSADHDHKVLEHEYIHFYIKRKLARKIVKTTGISLVDAFISADAQLFSPRGVLFEETFAIAKEFEMGATSDDHAFLLLSDRMYPLLSAIARGILFYKTLTIEIASNPSRSNELQIARARLMTQTIAITDELIKTAYKARFYVSKRLRERGVRDPDLESDLGPDRVPPEVQRWFMAEWLEGTPDSAEDLFLAFRKKRKGMNLDALNVAVEFAWKRYVLERDKVDYLKI